MLWQDGRVLNASSPPFIPQSLQITNQALNASRPPFISQSFPITNQAPPASMSMSQAQNSSDLISALAGAINANRLPTPEPALFTGNPLKFKDWRLSVETLIDRKNCEEWETVLPKEVFKWHSKESGQRTFSTRHRRSIRLSVASVRKRFGDPFLIGKSFRVKLHGWPKVSWG